MSDLLTDYAMAIVKDMTKTVAVSSAPPEVPPLAVGGGAGSEPVSDAPGFVGHASGSSVRPSDASLCNIVHVRMS